MVLLYAQKVDGELEILSEQMQPASHGARQYTPSQAQQDYRSPLALHAKN